MRLDLACLTVALFLPIVAAAGDEDEDHENWMVVADPVSIDDLTIHLKGAHAQATLIQVKAKIVNDGNDYYYFQPSAPVFDLGKKQEQPNGGKDKKPKLIKPGGSMSQTLKIKADSGLHVDEFTLTLAGFSKVAAKGAVHEAEEFQLPAARNSFSAGPFDCSLDSAKLTTGVSTLKFECTYTGKNVGWVDTREMGIRAPNGQEFANADGKATKTLVEAGGTVKMTGVFKAEKKAAGGLDMQFDKFHLLWRNTFSESKLEPVDAEEVDYEMDEELTKEKNE